jgi:ethanolamine utilization protein EutQ (cupin superfamily)
MDNPTPVVRMFDTATSNRAIQLGDHQIFMTPAVEQSEGRPLSAYSATFGRGERADLPAPYEEVWVVIHGRLRIRSGDSDITVGPGQFVHVPEDSPGEVEATEDTTLVCVSVPAH